MPTSCKRVRLVVKGRYFGENTATHIVVNEQELGDRDLHAGLELFLPIDSLLPQETIEIRFNHHHAVAASRVSDTEDGRRLAFGLRKLSCTYVMEEEYPGDEQDLREASAGAQARQ